MKTAEVHAIVRATLGPWFKSEGFRRARHCALGFVRPFTGQQVVVWFQADRWGWDPYLGGGFRFLITKFPNASSASEYEEAFQYFLTEPELEIVRQTQNSVIETLPTPPESYFGRIAAQYRSDLGKEMVESLRKQFQPVTEPYRWHVDFFLRYHVGDHVRRWCDLLAPILPRAVRCAETNWRRGRQ